MVFRAKTNNNGNLQQIQNLARPIISLTMTACLTLSCKQASELPLLAPAEATEDESADMPENISGIYLVACAVDKYPSKSAYGRYPCRIQNKKTGTLAPKPPASWNVITPEGKNAKVTQKPMDPASGWHLMFTVEGASGDDTTAIIQNSKVVANYASAAASELKDDFNVAISAGPKPNTKYQIIDGKFTYLKSEAIFAEMPGKKELICLAVYGGNLNPGRYDAKEDNCQFAHATNGLSAKEFVFLVKEPGLTWQESTVSTIPANAFNSGEESNLSPIHSCYGEVKPNNWSIGKTGKDYGGCDISINGTWQQVQTFKILVK